MFRPRVAPGFWQKLRGWLWPSMGWWRLGKYIIHRLARLDDSSQRLARGFASGVAISFTPLFGGHLVLAAALAWLTRGNIIAALLGTLVGNPVTFPLMWAVTYPSGLWLLSLFVPVEPMMVSMDAMSRDSMSAGGLWDIIGQEGFFRELFLPWLLGSLPWGVVAWFISMVGARVFVDALRRQRERMRRRKHKRRLAS